MRRGNWESLLQKAREKISILDKTIHKATQLSKIEKEQCVTKISACKSKKELKEKQKKTPIKILLNISLAREK